jgi:ribosome biogenesis GTPase
MKEYDAEEAFHSRDRKEGKKARRIASLTDRSKFKKTDQEIQKISLREDLRRGRVLSISGEGFNVDGEICSIRGSLKKEWEREKNLLAVGDYVRLEEGAIVQVEERKSVLSRTDISGRNRQLIATNVDQVIIVASVGSPPLKPALIDRYLIAAEKGNLTPFVVLNKIDLLEKKREYEEFLSSYEQLGIPILSVSATSKVGIEALKTLLTNRTSVFSGQSGVGKSSLLNVCFGLQRRVGELATHTEKGAHTTTVAELIELPGGGFVVDTPGIRSFGIWDLVRDDLARHFRDFPPCKFLDCSHRQEPGCGVLAALKAGTLPLVRYESYQTLLEELEGGKDNRTRRKENA